MMPIMNCRVFILKSYVKNGTISQITQFSSQNVSKVTEILDVSIQSYTHFAFAHLNLRGKKSCSCFMAALEDRGTRQSPPSIMGTDEDSDGGKEIEGGGKEREGSAALEHRPAPGVHRSTCL